MKFPTNKGMYTMRGSQLISKRCTSTCLKRKKNFCARSTKVFNGTYRS